MTDKYPLLTVESVTYWYWDCDPAYSTGDIAKATGTNQSAVLDFMEKNGILRRTMSEACLNRFKCKHKKEAFVRQRNMPEFKQKQSQRTSEYLSDPSKKKEMLSRLQKYVESILGEVQIQILYLLRKSEGMFLSDLKKIIKKGMKIIDSSLRKLYDRGFVTRQKQLNTNTFNSNSFQYYYSITDEGVALIAAKEKEPKFYSVFDFLDSILLRERSNGKNDSISVYLGKNQKEILRWFQIRNSLFLTDLNKPTSLENSVLDKSLKCLFKRGFLSRKKDINPNSSNYPKHYRYCITELGKKIKIE